MSALTQALAPIIGADQATALITALRAPGRGLRALMAVELFGAAPGGDTEPVRADPDAVGRRAHALHAAVATGARGEALKDAVEQFDRWLAGEHEHPSTPKTVLAIHVEDDWKHHTAGSAHLVVQQVLNSTDLIGIPARIGGIDNLASRIVDALLAASG